MGCSTSAAAGLPGGCCDFHKQYRLGQKIGKGTFAQVRSARRAGAANVDEVAVKIIDFRSSAVGKENCVDGTLRKAAIREFKLWRHLGNAPNCLPLFDGFIEGHLCFMVMEKCESTLLSMLRSAPAVTEGLYAGIFRQMLAGLSHCHSLGVIHRDVKPDNFMLSGGVLKLCDFGLAAALPAGSSAGVLGVVGTPPFMSPEMLRKEAYDGKTDVWSFGVLAYLLLFGAFPYYSRTPAGVKAAILSGVVVPQFAAPGLASNRPSVDAEVFVGRLLSRDVAARPTVAEVLTSSWVREECCGASSEMRACLRPVLDKAELAGAFDHPDLSRDVRGVDQLLFAEQERSGQCSGGLSPMKVGFAFISGSTGTPPATPISDGKISLCGSLCETQSTVTGGSDPLLWPPSIGPPAAFREQTDISFGSSVCAGRELRI